MIFVRLLIRKSLFNYQAKKLIAAGVTTTAYNLSNYYEALGIPSSSTQNDIKAAYYELSKIYHPDKNMGSDSAAKKFREITQAYEVLGNYRLRRLYDKGVIQTGESQYAHAKDINVEDVEDDAETKFYKSRFKKSKVSDMTGRTPIYDFDEWSRAHYGKSFERRKTAKTKFDRKESEKKSKHLGTQNEILMFLIFFSVVAMYSFIYAEQSYDAPAQKDGDKRKTNS